MDSGIGPKGHGHRPEPKCPDGNSNGNLSPGLSVNLIRQNVATRISRRMALLGASSLAAGSTDLLPAPAMGLSQIPRGLRTPAKRQPASFSITLARLRRSSCGPPKASSHIRALPAAFRARHIPPAFGIGTPIGPRAASSASPRSQMIPLFGEGRRACHRQLHEFLRSPV